ncbi:MAG: sulfurtransferase [Leptothrix sp. (in: b-proteobacteria)]
MPASAPVAATLPAPLISAADLAGWLGRAVLLDTSFDLADPAAGEAAYRSAHLPGAFYLHLDRDLSTAKTGRNGRHPLPAREVFAATVGALGIGVDTPVVVYDRQGAMFAARAWWMLRWLGHTQVAVLDGGVAAWSAAGGALQACDGPARPAAAPAYPLTAAPAMPTLDADALQAQLGRVCLIDARAPERFRGDVEPLDPVAGHIPGALNRNFKDNLGADGRFLPAAELHAAFVALTGERAAAEVVQQCGSGVTACHNLLAMEAAGLSGSALYPGSWSEWCSDSARPVARG